MASQRTQRMRELLKKGIVVSPGVYDGYSARLAERLGFEAVSTTGVGIAHSRLGVQDIGIMSMMENVQAVRLIARGISLPVMCDADTGYGNAVTAYHTVQFFEDAGVVGINLEDQVNPKRCGHMAGKEVVGSREAAKKIEAAAKAKRDPNFIINARTDSVVLEGIEAAIKRARMYVSAGADMVYPSAFLTEDNLKRFVDEVRAPVSINMGFGLRSRTSTPLIPISRLAKIGVVRVTYSRLLTGAAIAGMRKALEVLTQTVHGVDPGERDDLIAGMEEITNLMGYDRIAALESQFLLEDEIDRKYASGKPDYLVRSTQQEKPDHAATLRRNR